MRILHLFSNHKITGPAELALDTCRAVESFVSAGEHVPAWAADEGIESYFLPGRHPRDPFWIGELARERQARLVEVPGLRLRKHFNPFSAMRDARVLAEHIQREKIDLVHCHLPNDHLIASMAIARLPGRTLPIVRTLYDGNEPPASWRVRRTLGRSSAHVICFSEQVRDALTGGRLRLPAERVSRLEAPIDTERFEPERREDLVDGRAFLGIDSEAFVAGIVARMQTHRRFEVLLAAIRRVADQLPGFRFVIIGRGTNQVKVAREPVRHMGLEDTVIFAGYLGGDEYVAALCAMDVKVFLVPGSDGTCRAVREALAAGIPVIAARRGMLAEIVEDGVSGLVIDDSAENLARAIVDLGRDRHRVERMSRAARARAEERFSYARYARDLLDVYGAVTNRIDAVPARSE